MTAVKNNAGPLGQDAVATLTRSALVPKTPEIFTHDADGNLETDGRWQYTWDAENRLLAMETLAVAATAGAAKQRLEFAYDDTGRRVAKRVYAWDTVAAAWTLSSSRAFLWDGWTLLAELEVSGGGALTPATTYAWGHEFAAGAGDGSRHLLLVRQLTGDGAGDYAPIQGANYNLAGYVDLATGAQVAAYDYGPFGESVSTTGPRARDFRFRFSTKSTDDETGLLYYGHRYYSPSTGRWLSRDPVGEAGGVNVYQFLGSDALNWVDALGLEPMGTLAELFPEQAAKLDGVKTGKPVSALARVLGSDPARIAKVQKGFAAPRGSTERKVAQAIVGKALDSSTRELRDMAIKEVVNLLVKRAGLPTANETPADFIPGLAGAALFAKCVSIQADCYRCLAKDPCNARCDEICAGAKKCFEIAGKAADVLQDF